MIARLTLEGYAAKEIVLTEGPMNWVSMKGHNHGDYWLLKTENFHAELQAISQVFAGGAVDSVSRVTAGTVIGRTSAANQASGALFTGSEQEWDGIFCDGYGCCGNECTSGSRL